MSRPAMSWTFCRRRGEGRPIVTQQPTEDVALEFVETSTTATPFQVTPGTRLTVQAKWLSGRDRVVHPYRLNP
jgi:hypothetical protein